MIRTFVDGNGKLLYSGATPPAGKVTRILAVPGAIEINWTAGIPPGTVWNGNAWVAPVVAPPTPQEEALSRLIAGIALVYKAAPQLSGTYAIDLQAQANISGIVTSLNAGQGFPPKNAPTLDYGDLAGIPHPFDSDSFIQFATLIRDYIYSIDITTRTLAAGGKADWPEQPIIVA